MMFRVREERRHQSINDTTTKGESEAKIVCRLPGVNIKRMKNIRTSCGKTACRGQHQPQAETIDNGGSNIPDV